VWSGWHFWYRHISQLFESIKLDTWFSIHIKEYAQSHQELAYRWECRHRIRPWSNSIYNSYKKVKLVENSLNASYNLQKVDWKNFEKHLQKAKDKMIVKMQRITSLKAKVIYLTECIKNTVELFVFKQRICAKSKLWWNNELIERWKALSSKKRIWKRCRSDDVWTEIVQTRNSYHDAIKLIKNQFWTNFLNNVEEKEVFQTYKFTKSRLIEKLLSIQNSQKELKIEFNEKCEAFLKAMYSPSSKIQINEELLSNESIQWSRVIEGKIKYAINFSALRKAFEPDEMSFAIIQRAYKTISKIFNLVYSDLIENDYHSKIWREGTKIILKKIRQVELFNFEGIQNYYAAKLFRQSSRKNNSSATVVHSWN